MVTVDFDELLERVGGDHDLVSELIDIFLADAPGLVSELRAGASDLPRLRAAAHTLKGASGNMSANLARDAAERLQFAAAGGDAVGAERARVALIEEMDRALAVFAASRLDPARGLAS
jgi:HPt (histidine-containing phosphotransfer) domain-containing protein